MSTLSGSANQARERKPGPRSVEAIVRPSEHLCPARPDDRCVLIADPAVELGSIHTRLGDDHHVLTELVRAPGYERGARLVQPEADAVAGVMRELLEARARARRTRGRVDISSGGARHGGCESGGCGFAHGLVGGSLRTRRSSG